MNKRINELANEAGLQPFEDCGPGYVYKMEKFAELIVRECANRALLLAEDYREVKRTQDLDTLDYVIALEKIARDIKQHFGVEE